MNLISSDCEHLLRTETSQNFLLKAFYYNNKDTRKDKYFQKLSNKEIYFPIPSNSTKYSKTFILIPLPNILEGHHILGPEIWGKTFIYWFKKCSHGYIFSNHAVHRTSNAPIILCYPSCSVSLTSHLIKVRTFELRPKNFLK